MKEGTRIKGVPLYTGSQLTALVVLRMLIGWHILYEGITKLFNPNWSSAPYLIDSKWIFGSFFQSLAADPGILKVVDFLNVYGLVAIGLGLILGFFTRTAIVAGIALLSLYFLSHPPLIGLKYAIPNEGSTLIVNKSLIEIFALVVLAVFPTGKIIGLDRLLAAWRGTLYETRKEETKTFA
jgi:thiosulfate dehydrogenase [quinone] large subunit